MKPPLGCMVERDSLPEEYKSRGRDCESAVTGFVEFFHPVVMVEGANQTVRGQERDLENKKNGTRIADRVPAQREEPKDQKFNRNMNSRMRPPGSTVPEI